MDGSGGEEQELVVPVWFTGDQLPPSLRKKRRVRTNNDDDADHEEAAGQNVPGQQRQKYKRKRATCSESPATSL